MLWNDISNQLKGEAVNLVVKVEQIYLDVMGV